ncbi:helix-turn-helix domain-containing protein [Echinicola shivajiensis]|uniref:helix-turn-helix domain-containing protein n=1 Tax=Echinicola shivajiensis TaxID=1035916 RepID=UPI001BFC4185|nr:helix-turn-helix domain-containing protein [Echinicola shivajiensis]
MLDAINLKEKYKIFSTPKSEVEHRTAHQADHAVLNVYETSRLAHSFDLQFDNPVIVSMIQGKKIMHLKSQDGFEFLPGQSIVMPASELMYIDFPEATHNDPTQCLALEISEGFVQETMAWLNEHFPKVDEEKWSWSKDNFLLMNNQLVQENLNSLIRVMVDNGFGKQMKASNTTRELIASLMQTQARHYLLQNVDKLSTRNRLAHVVRFIRQNLQQNLDINGLASQACLSRAQFFRAFQRELGETPVRFVNRERLELAKKQILWKGSNITEACFESGFSSVNYFSRVFKQFEGISPTEWKERELVRKRA